MGQPGGTHSLPQHDPYGWNHRTDHRDRLSLGSLGSLTTVGVCHSLGLTARCGYISRFFFWGTWGLKMLDFKAWNLSGVAYLDGWTDGKAVRGTTWFHRLKRTQWVQIFQIFDSHHYISSLWELAWISWDDSGASANSVFTLRCIWRLGPHRI